MSGRTITGVDELERALTAVLERYPDVKLAYLFGSQARGTARTLSDVDVAILLEEDGDRHAVVLELAAELSGAAGGRHVDVVVLNTAPVALAYRVIRDGRLLLSRDERARVEHWARTVDRYIDMAPFRRTLAEGTRHRIDEGRFGRR